MSVAILPDLKKQTSAKPLNGDALYEIVHGDRVELPAMSMYASLISSRLHGKLWNHVDQHGPGMVVSETLFIINAEDEVRRRPDVAFVSKERWPLDKPIPLTGDWLVVPDVAIEVISPNDLFQDVYEKLKEYFEYGVRQVWVVMPREQEILIYTSPTECRKLTTADTLDGGELISGFRLDLADLFKQPVTAV